MWKKNLWWFLCIGIVFLALIGFGIFMVAFTKHEAVSALSAGTSSPKSDKPFVNSIPFPLVTYDYDGAYRITTIRFPSTDPSGASPLPLLLAVDPFPSADQRGKGNYLTLDSVDSCFVLPFSPQKIVSSDKNAGRIEKIGQSNGLQVYRARSPGYFRFQMPDKNGDSSWYDVFVSPVPSRHLDRMDADWYLTQWNTITKSNCGPSVAAMSVGWARGQDVSVVTIRNRLGWNGAGEVGMDELQSVLSDFNVKSKLIDLGSVRDMFAVLERGDLLAVSYDMAGIAEAADPLNDVRGQYYADHGGHYLALKGYSLDHKYFIVYDPIPSDWQENRLRYGDGVSMLGRNRYYDANQLWNALRSTQALEVSR